jgi:hypothetical protein
MNKIPENKDKKTSGLATASLVLGIFAIILGWIPFFGWIFIILALSFGIRAIIKINQGLNSGRGLAIAGVILGSIGLLFAIIVLAMTIKTMMGGYSCSDLSCFVSKANECTKATYKETSDIGKISYSITFDNENCILTKEMVELSKNEDPFLKKALEGKKMECTYLPGDFNDQWMVSMIMGLEDCHGELKDAIGHLLLVI